MAIDAVERDRGAVSHAVVGAYLLSLWGLPSGIIEAVAFHHAPESLHGTLFDASVAVHVADAMVTRPNNRTAPELHAASVEAAGITVTQLDACRARCGSLETAA